MIGFEILVNGKRLYTIGVGDFGILGAEVILARVKTIAGPIHEQISVWGQSRPSEGPEDRGCSWPWHDVIVGDEVTIRIIETDAFDPGESAGAEPND